MSLIISVYVPTGIILSGDSRTTLTIQQQSTPATPQSPSPAIVQTNVTLSDATNKVFLLFRRFGAGTFGEAIINNLPIAHYVEQFELQRSNAFPESTHQLANDLLQFFRALTPIPALGFVVAGYDGNDPWVISVNVQGDTSQRVNLNQDGQLQYGIIRGGDTAIVDRLLSQPQFNPLFNVMNLQDAVDYSRHLIRSTIDQMRFEPRFPTVGGPIDTLVVTSAGASFLICKEIHG